MYKIEWFDDKTGEHKKLNVHTLRAASEVVNTLRLQPTRNLDVRMQYNAPRRVREIVIKLV